MEPMGYTRWENFAEVVKRAKVSCETNKTPVDSHFRDTTKMVTAGVAARAVKDYKLTRYACYLIAQNGDSNKPEIALAQAYHHKSGNIILNRTNLFSSLFLSRANI